MAFPTTITTGGDTVEGGATPYLSSGGNVYVIVRDDTTTSKLRAFKAIDPTSSFSNVGTDPQVTSTNPIKGIGTYQVGDIIHVVTLDYTSVAGGIDLRYHTFSMSSDSWTLTNETIKDNYSMPTSDTGADFPSISVRSDGDVIVLYNGPMVANMGSDRNRVYYARRESAVWTVDVIVDNGGATSWVTGGIVLGSSDRHHLFFQDNDADDGYQRTLRGANTLETFPSAFDTAINASHTAMIQSGTSYVSGANTKVRYPYYDGGGAVSVVKLDSADTPTVSTDAAIFTALGSGTPNFYISLSADGTNLWVTFIEVTTADLATASNNDEAGWSSSSTFYTGTADTIQTNVYTRNGDIVLAMVFMETDPKYHEKLLVAGDVSLFLCDFEMDFGGRRRR